MLSFQYVMTNNIEIFHFFFPTESLNHKISSDSPQVELIAQKPYVVSATILDREVLGCLGQYTLGFPFPFSAHTLTLTSFIFST